MRTREQVKAEFRRKGISIKAWATANGFNPNLVYDILSERVLRPCLRGESHRIAVRLGLKHGEIAKSIRRAI